MLSVVISAWNEEKTLPRVIASVRPIADEIVVVDTESTDKTVEIAKKLGCKVYSHANTGVVEPVRNFSIEKAKGDWILLLDADEEVTHQLIKKIREIIKTEESDYYRIPRKNIIFGKWIKSSHWWPDYVYRLFKKGSVNWEDKIHSVPTTRGIGKDISTKEEYAIVHHHYMSVSQFIQRLDRYTDHQMKHLLEDGYTFKWSDLVDKPISEFLRQYFARLGYKDGLHGLVLSCLQAFSEFVLYLKLWQENDFVQQPVTPSDLQTQLTLKRREYRWWLSESKIQLAPFWKKPWLKLTRRLWPER